MKTDNEFIAEFMGLTHANETNHSALYSHTDWEGGEWAYGPHDLCYHSSWDWLMPVVERIQEIRKNGYEFKYRIENHFCYIECRTRQSGTSWPDEFINTATTTIEATHRSVVAFIKWHNAQKA